MLTTKLLLVLFALINGSSLFYFFIARRLMWEVIETPEMSPDAIMTKRAAMMTYYQRANRLAVFSLIPLMGALILVIFERCYS